MVTAWKGKKMKKKTRIIIETFRENKWFLLILICLELFCFLSIWLIDNRKAEAIAGMLFMLTAVLLMVFGYAAGRKFLKKQTYLEHLLEQEGWQQEAIDTNLLSWQEQYLLEELGQQLNEKEKRQKQLETEKKQQEEYVETWVHEIKTPIALAALLLDNRKEEMSREVYQRMRYVNVKLQEYVEQIFFYSKLNCEHKDYIFRRVFLQECVEHAIEDYRYFLEEKQIHITMDLGNAQVLTDQRSLEFILAQLLANAITYLPVMQEEKEISFMAQHREKEVILLVKDNGIGVKPSDLPFVFEKGFSGDNQEVNKKTTGMGLYLVRELAKSLNLGCQAQSEHGKGFGVELRFPVV